LQFALARSTGLYRADLEAWLQDNPWHREEAEGAALLDQSVPMAQRNLGTFRRLFSDTDQEAAALLGALLAFDPRDRRPARAVLGDPIFAPFRGGWRRDKLDRPLQPTCAEEAGGGGGGGGEGQGQGQGQGGRLDFEFERSDCIRSPKQCLELIQREVALWG
jgi:hypothetical protein